MRNRLRWERDALGTLRRFAFVVLGDSSRAEVAIDVGHKESNEKYPDIAAINHRRLLALKSLFEKSLEVSAPAKPPERNVDLQGARHSDEANYLTALRTLPITERAATALVIVEQLSYDDASYVMSADREKIQTYLVNARKQLSRHD